VMKAIVSRTAIFMASSRLGSRPITIQWVGVSARGHVIFVLAHDELESSTQSRLHCATIDLTLTLDSAREMMPAGPQD
jgi:hypothetical protein